MRNKFASFLIVITIVVIFSFFVQPVLAASNPPPGGSGSSEPCPNNKCDTAIGNIDVSSPVAVIMRIFSFALSLASIGALIVIIYSGYRLLVSRGNKEIIQGARETLTSAIVGLLFMIFSLVILSVVAGDIIKIPGFN